MTNLDVIKSEQNDTWSNNTGRRRSPVHNQARSSPIPTNQSVHPDINFWRLLNYERDSDANPTEEAPALEQLYSPCSSTPSESPPLLGGGYTSNGISGYSINSLPLPSYPVTSSSYLSTLSQNAAHPGESILPSNCSDIIKSMAAKYKRFEQYSSVLRKLSQMRSSTICSVPMTEHRRRFSPPPQVTPSKASNIPPIYPLNINTNNQRMPSSTYDLQANSLPSVSAPIESQPLALSSAQLLLSMARSAKCREEQMTIEPTHPSTENHNKFISSKRPNEPYPLDLSSSPPLDKRPRLESEEIDIVGDCKSEPATPNTASISSHQSGCNRDSVFSFNGFSNTDSAQEVQSVINDPSKWSIEQVHQFVKSIDICAEYAESFLLQRIDGWCLSLLTECHLTATLNMKLGPALKLLSKLKELQDSAKCSKCATANSDTRGHVNSDVNSHITSDVNGLFNSDGRAQFNNDYRSDFISDGRSKFNVGVNSPFNNYVNDHQDSNNTYQEGGSNSLDMNFT